MTTFYIGGDVLHYIGDKVIDDFLYSQSKQGTLNTYKTIMKLYLTFTKKSGQQLLDEKKSDKDFQVENSMFQFRKHILEERSEAYATTAIGCIRGFYAYYRMPLTFRRTESKKLTEQNRSTSDYLFDREDLTKMALARSLKERYVLIVGKSIGLRAGDFVKLTFGQFRSLKLDNEPPIALVKLVQVKRELKHILSLTLMQFQ